MARSDDYDLTNAMLPAKPVLVQVRGGGRMVAASKQGRELLGVPNSHKPVHKSHLIFIYPQTQSGAFKIDYRETKCLPSAAEA